MANLILLPLYFLLKLSHFLVKSAIRQFRKYISKITIHLKQQEPTFKLQKHQSRKVFNKNSKSPPFLYLHKKHIHVLWPSLTLLHSERPKLYTILAFLSAIGFKLPTKVLEIHKIKVVAQKLNKQNFQMPKQPHS